MSLHRFQSLSHQNQAKRRKAAKLWAIQMEARGNTHPFLQDLIDWTRQNPNKKREMSRTKQNRAERRLKGGSSMRMKAQGSSSGTLQTSPYRLMGLAVAALSNMSESSDADPVSHGQDSKSTDLKAKTGDADQQEVENSSIPPSLDPEYLNNMPSGMQDQVRRDFIERATGTNQALRSEAEPDEAIQHMECDAVSQEVPEQGWVVEDAEDDMEEPEEDANSGYIDLMSGFDDPGQWPAWDPESDEDGEDNEGDVLLLPHDCEGEALLANIAEQSPSQTDDVPLPQQMLHGSGQASQVVSAPPLISGPDSDTTDASSTTESERRWTRALPDPNADDGKVAMSLSHKRLLAQQTQEFLKAGYRNAEDAKKAAKRARNDRKNATLREQRKRARQEKSRLSEEFVVILG